MRTVWKFNIPFESFPAINMPKGAEILHVNTQGNDFRIWARVEPSNPLEIRNFMLLATGAEVHCLDQKYLGTFKIQDGLLMYHLFEI